MSRQAISTRDLQRGIREKRAQDAASRWIAVTAPHWGGTVRSTSATRSAVAVSRWENEGGTVRPPTGTR